MASFASMSKVGKDFKQEFESFGANQRSEQETAISKQFWKSDFGGMTKKAFNISDQAIEHGDITPRQASELKNQ